MLCVWCVCGMCVCVVCVCKCVSAHVCLDLTTVIGSLYIGVEVSSRVHTTAIGQRVVKYMCRVWALHCMLNR